MNSIIESGSFKEEIEKVPTNTQIQMRLAKEMTDKKVLQGVTSQRYLDCLKETLIGIRYIEGEQLENILAKYDENYKEYLSPYLDDLTLELIQSFSKVVLHNNQYIQGIIKLLKDNGYDSLAYMTILVKN